jgi:cell pole-organizing protein PopZ
MSDTNAQEPTMEEILASIRRIISEDDAPAAGAAPAAAAAPEPEAANEEAHAEPPPQIQAFDEGDDDDVLELTEPAPPLHEPEPAEAHAAPAEALGDLEVFPRAAPPPRPAPQPQPVAAADSYGEPEAEGLISNPNADLAATAFGQLSRTLAMPAEGRTLEDVVRELLRPMLKDWLDRNLSGIVETAVQSEVERISRLRRF